MKSNFLSHAILGLALSLPLSGCIIAVSPSQPRPSSTPTSSPSASPTTNPGTIPVGGGPSASPTVGPGPGQVTTPGTVQTPTTPGFHLIDTDFTAPNLPLSVSSNGVTMSFERSAYKTGETIRLSYSAGGTVEGNAWIGVIPSNTAHGDEAANDQNDIDYKYLQGKNTAVLEFKAPGTPGNFDFRFNENDSGGRELASLSFVTTHSLSPGTQSSVNISLSPGPYRAGQPVTLSFTAPANFDANAWIGLLPADKPHGSEDANDQFDLAYQYISGRTSGEMTFNLPSTPGRYDFRMHDRDGGGSEACYFVFDVVP